VIDPHHRDFFSLRTVFQFDALKDRRHDPGSPERQMQQMCDPSNGGGDFAAWVVNGKFGGDSTPTDASVLKTGSNNRCADAGM
jgi:hypothetical protein